MIKRIWLSSVTLIVIMLHFSLSAFAAPGPGILRGNTAYGGVPTDGSDSIAYYSNYFNYSFSTPQDIESYYLYATKSSVNMYLLDANDKVLATVPAKTSASTTPTAFTSKVLQVKKVQIYDPNDSKTSFGVYEVDLYAVPPVPQPPAVPQGLSATPGDKEASLSWTANTETDLKEYKIYKDGSYLATVPKGTASYKATSLTNGTTYSFQVSAVNTGGLESNKSSAVTAKPMAAPDTTPPSAPTGVKAVDGGLKAVVTWNANTESDLASYNLYMDGKKTLSGLTKTTAEVTGLTRGQTYSFRVTAVDTSGNESAKSSEATVTIANVLDVKFIPNMDSIIVQVTGGSPPYTVDWGEGSDTFNATKYTISNLQPSTNYTVTITDMAGQTATQIVNTGNMKSFNPPTMPDPTSLFQKLIDNFGTAGTIALAVIGGAVGLGILCILGIWGWRLSKRWLSAAK